MLKTQAERVRAAAAAVLAIVLAIIAYFGFILPQQGKTDDVHSQINDVKAQNATLEHKIATLAAQNADFATYQRAYQQAQLALPSSSGLPDLLRSLQSIGGATLTDVPSFTAGTPTDVSSVAGSKKKTTGGMTVYALPITTEVSGTAEQLDAFLTQLQSVQPRAVLISSITQTSDKGAHSTAAGTITLDLTMQAFVAPPAN